MADKDSKGSKFYKNFSKISYGFGLRLFSFSTAQDEPRKRVFKWSRLWMFVRSFIHIIPTIGIITIMFFNVKSDMNFRGGNLVVDGSDTWDAFLLGFLQIMAKLLETLIIASLGTMLVDLGRFMLASSDGMPFGLIASPFLFSQPSYFASAEYSASYKGFKDMPSSKSKRKLAFLLVATTICGAIAAIIGPASAVLMVPRLTTEWPCEGNEIYLHNLPENLWPSTFSASAFGKEDSDCRSLGDHDPVELIDCPLGGYRSLMSHWQYPTSHARKNQTHEWIAEEGFFRRTVYIRGRDAKKAGDMSWAISPQLAVARVATYVKDSWDDGESHLGHSVGGRHSASKKEHRKRARSFKTIAKAFAPAVQTECAEFQHITYPQTGDLAYPSTMKVPFGGYGNIDLEIPSLENGQHIRIQWNPRGMRPDPKKHSFTFAMFGGYNDTSRGSSKAKWMPLGAMICTVDARWILSEVMTDTRSLSGAVQLRLETKNKEKKPIVWEPQQWTLKEQHPMRFDESGFNELDRYWTSNEKGGAHVTSLGLLFYTSQYLGQSKDGLNNLEKKARRFEPAMMESLVASYFVDVLSKIGYRDQNPKELNSGQHMHATTNVPINPHYVSGKVTKLGDKNVSIDYTRIKLNVTLEGYVLALTAWFHWLSVAVLASYLFLIFIYTIYMIFYGETSRAWDSVSEIIALAHSSRPSLLLRNTCAGIRSGETLRRNIRIAFARPTGDKTIDSTAEELQLVFRGDENEHLYDDFGTGGPLESDLERDLGDARARKTSSVRFRKYGNRGPDTKMVGSAVVKLGSAAFSMVKKDKVGVVLYPDDHPMSRAGSTASSRTFLAHGGPPAGGSGSGSDPEDYEMSRVPYHPASMETAYTSRMSSNGYQPLQDQSDYGYMPPLAEEFPFYPQQGQGGQYPGQQR